jgi:HK97 gp10 family phage protein
MDISEYIIEDHTKEVKEAAEDAILRALETVGLFVEGEAKLRAPVDTGRLRNSITHEVVPDELAVYIGSNVEYAPYQEYGTSKMKAHPYLHPAITQNMGTIKDIIKAELEGEGGGKEDPSLLSAVIDGAKEGVKIGKKAGKKFERHLKRSTERNK